VAGANVSVAVVFGRLRPMMCVALCYEHRIVNGVIDNPERMLPGL
jgi:hypothetical protein